MKFLKKLSLMICMFTLMLSVSTVAYAAFTRQYTPQVKPFSITVATQENMLISSTGDTGDFADMVNFSDLIPTTVTNLQPLEGVVELTGNDYENLTLKDGTNVVYTSKDPDDNVNVNNKYIEFNLYFIGSSDMNLYLGNDTVRTIISLDESSYANLSFTTAQKQTLLSSMRVAFLTYATTYPEDYTGLHIRYSDSPVSANIYKTTASTDTYSDYVFSQVGYNTVTHEGTVLAATERNQITKIKVVIWLESANLDTTILSAIADLKFNIAFQAVKV